MFDFQVYNHVVFARRKNVAGDDVIKLTGVFFDILIWGESSGWEALISLCAINRWCWGRVWICKAFGDNDKRPSLRAPLAG
jgi:hypothetical protein